MKYIPIKTPVLKPPQDNLFQILENVFTDLCEGDLILITSKVVSIHQGRCVPVDQAKKRNLVKQEADYLIKGYEEFNLPPLAIKHHALFYDAGIDESNADGHYVLLPEKPFDEAERIWKFISEKYDIHKFGVIITDSHSQPMRIGAIGIAIGWWGFHPIESHRGKKDLFNRPLHFSVTNIVDCVAAGAGAVCGETNESTPIVIARDVPNIQFTKIDTRHDLFKSRKEDIFYPLLKPFYKDE